ncbi:type IX secretion system membrane protein PorP/SprF [Leeuwenhoekiella sp. NPDC079379]|uniref:type IX secretion system membrane protein PorP/SprF n=1 Tax=Leeuwenhoekiella sp. NPDC079379 TaxID=3364122 RepID=UPI0037CA30C7
MISMKTSTSKFTFFAVLVLFCTSMFAQQDPEYTQYMYNMSVINPAYSSVNKAKIGGIYRAQWVSIDGAPTTASFFGHLPISDKVELGLNIVHDEIGDVVQETNLNADFAYKLPVQENATLSLGIKAGASFFSTDFSRLQLGSGGPATDPSFDQNINRTYPTIGIGAYYFSEKYYVGLSAPNLVASQHLEDQNGVQRLGSENTHYFFTGGYVFEPSSDFQIKPSFMARWVNGAPVSIDVNANVRFYQRFEAGIGYRIDDAVTGMLNFEVTPGVRVGYAYDYTTSNLGAYNNGSHEVMILFDFDLLSKLPSYLKSPRFF